MVWGGAPTQLSIIFTMIVVSFKIRGKGGSMLRHVHQGSLLPSELSPGWAVMASRLRPPSAPTIWPLTLYSLSHLLLTLQFQLSSCIAAFTQEQEVPQ